jgi:hypothetical protein
VIPALCLLAECLGITTFLLPILLAAVFTAVALGAQSVSKFFTDRNR